MLGLCAKGREGVTALIPENVIVFLGVLAFVGTLIAFVVPTEEG